jgi:DNA mismatch repair protein MutS
VEAVEHAETLVFLHSVKDGPANQSYGLQVAALAGIPRSVTAEARRYLTELERERDALRGHLSPQQPQLSLFTAPPSAVLDTLCALDPEELSSREALDLVFKLRDAARTERGRT